MFRHSEILTFRKVRLPTLLFIDIFIVLLLFRHLFATQMEGNIVDPGLTDLTDYGAGSTEKKNTYIAAVLIVARIVMLDDTVLSLKTLVHFR